jgi:hypothetical protein
MFGKSRPRDLEHDLAGPRRPAIRLLGLLKPFSSQQISTKIPETSGPTAMSARITRSLAAITSSRSAAAFDGAPRRARSWGANADQFEVTRGLICANQ